MPLMCRDATATGSSWNCTWNCRLTYSLGVSGYGHFSLSRNSCAMPGWSVGGRVSSHTPSHQSASCPVPVTQPLSIAPIRDAPAPAWPGAGGPALARRPLERAEPVRVELDEREVQGREPLRHPATD